MSPVWQFLKQLKWEINFLLMKDGLNQWHFLLQVRGNYLELMLMLLLLHVTLCDSLPLSNIHNRLEGK